MIQNLSPASCSGIVWNMTQKPGAASAIAALVGGDAVGVAPAMRFMKAGAVDVTAAVEPAA